MVGSTTPSHGDSERLPASSRIITPHQLRTPSERKQNLTAGEIYNVETLVKRGFVMDDDSGPPLRGHAGRPGVSAHRVRDVTPEGRLTLLGVSEKRDVRGGERRGLLTDHTGRATDASEDLVGDTARRRTPITPREDTTSDLSEDDAPLSVEAVWGSSSGVGSVQDRLQLTEMPAALERMRRADRAEVSAVRYLLGGEESEDGKRIEETTIRCFKAGARAAAARRRHFRQGNACARLAAWAQPPGDTAFHPVPPTLEIEKKHEKRHAVKDSPCLVLRRRAEMRNYHLFAQKSLLPTGPCKDSLLMDMPSGEDENTRKMDISASLIFLDPCTHRLGRRRATVKLNHTAPTGDEVTGADGGKVTRTFTPGTPRDAEHLPLLTDDKSLETTAKLLEAFERCHPDAAGWLLTSDIRWTLPRDLRVQEIFGLARRQKTGSRRDGGEETNCEAQRGANGGCLFSWTDGANAIEWAKELLRNRDEPVRFVRENAYRVHLWWHELSDEQLRSAVLRTPVYAYMKRLTCELLLDNVDLTNTYKGAQKSVETTAAPGTIQKMCLNIGAAGQKL